MKMTEPPKWMEKKVRELAYAMYGKYRTGKQFHLTAIFSNKKMLSIGWNDYRAIHPAHRFGEYKPYKANTDDYQPSVHSEVAALIRLGEQNTKKYTFVNVRIGPNGFVNLAKPCANCQRVLEQIGFKKLYYSDANGNFRLWTGKEDEDTNRPRLHLVSK